MKKTITLLTIAGMAAISNAQTVADFENLQLNPNSFWNGNDGSGGFESGNAYFYNEYSNDWGGFWAGGFAYSNMKDNTTAGWTNQYSAFTTEGYNGSANYAVSQNNSVIRLTGNAQGKVVNGFYVTNTTFAALSMRDGDMFGKKFGSPNNAAGEADGTEGKDWFKLSITGWFNGEAIEDTVEFYLADYTFDDNSQNYIVKEWTWVDLLTLGNLDSLIFHLSSSDVGDWGMNTPAYFAMDNFTTADSPVSIHALNDNKSGFKIYPNPATSILNLEVSELKAASAYIMDMNGRIVKTITCNNLTNTFDISDLAKGNYILRYAANDELFHQLIIKH
jgi:hypothetical protein